MCFAFELQLAGAVVTCIYQLLHMHMADTIQSRGYARSNELTMSPSVGQPQPSEMAAGSATVSGNTVPLLGSPPGYNTHTTSGSVTTAGVTTSSNLAASTSAALAQSMMLASAYRRGSIGGNGISGVHSPTGQGTLTPTRGSGTPAGAGAGKPAAINTSVGVGEAATSVTGANPAPAPAPGYLAARTLAATQAHITGTGVDVEQSPFLRRSHSAGDFLPASGGGGGGGSLDDDIAAPYPAAGKPASSAATSMEHYRPHERRGSHSSQSHSQPPPPRTQLLPAEAKRLDTARGDGNFDLEVVQSHSWEPPYTPFHFAGAGGIRVRAADGVRQPGVCSG